MNDNARALCLKDTFAQLKEEGRTLGTFATHKDAIDALKVKAVLDKAFIGHRYCYQLGGNRQGVVVVGRHGYVQIYLGLTVDGNDTPFAGSCRVSTGYETALATMDPPCDEVFECLIDDLLCTGYPVHTLIDMLDHVIDHPDQDTIYSNLLGDLRNIVQPGIDLVIRRYQV